MLREKLEQLLEAARGSIAALLDQAAEEVLENMFFSGVTGEVMDEPDSERLCATVAFAGSSEGELRVSAPRSTVAILAAGFLGY